VRARNAIVVLADVSAVEREVAAGVAARERCPENVAVVERCLNRVVAANIAVMPSFWVMMRERVQLETPPGLIAV
jgi:hypothetical protein